jgi:hypothetical protein
LFIVADKVAPTGLTLQTDLPLGKWMDDPYGVVNISGAVDDWSGLAGYSFTWDQSPTGRPDAAIDPIQIRSDGRYDAWISEGPSNYLHMRAVDHSGNAGETVTLGPFMLDISVPEHIDITSSDVRLRYQDDRKIEVAWTPSSDALSGLDPEGSYVFEVSHIASGDPDAKWSGGSSTTNETEKTISAIPGRTYCISVWALDLLGHEGHGDYHNCTSVPIDDTRLDTTSEWQRVTGSDYYVKGASATKQRGATILKRAVRARRLAALVTTCPKCGRLVARFNGSVVAKVDLSSTRRRTKRIVELATFGREKEGSLRLEVVSRGRRVEVDGLGAWRRISS